MKIFTGNNSLLRGSGLLLICLYLLYISQPANRHAAKSGASAELIIESPVSESTDTVNYIKKELGKIFPVLKSLNLM